MSESHTAHAVLMISPKHFGFNQETASSNLFQNRPRDVSPEQVMQRAVQEFDGLRDLLISNGVRVLAFDDADSPVTPDSLFPNNWITTHADGTIVLYPMEGGNRRLERRQDIVNALKREFGFGKFVDLTPFESSGRFLEGTGSMVLDRSNSAVYACISSRTDASLLRDLTGRINLRNTVLFDASVRQNGPETEQIYHTNVLMAIGEEMAVLCSEVINGARDREKVVRTLRDSGHEVVEISVGQMFDFAGNMLQLRNQMDELLWIMSTRAYDSLSDLQRGRLGKRGARLCHTPLDTIEHVGGGSARCMLAEIFPPG